MDGFRAYKYYAAIKLHFTSPKYDVFVSKGRVKCSLERFRSRNDSYLFDKLGGKFSSDKDYIQFIASNFMYHNPEVVYSGEEAYANYKEYLRRKQSITKIFEDDLNTILDSGTTYNFSGHKIPDVIQLWMADKITLETVVILNDMDDFTEKLKENAHINLLLGDDLLRIEKSKGFVKYNSYKIMSYYVSFIEEIKGITNGSHIPQNPLSV